MVHKPMAIGIAGLADLFQRMRIPYDSDKAKEIATEIVREIYYSAVECSLKSCYGKKLEESEKYILHSIKYGIADERTMKLQEEIKKHGVTILAYVGLMPTSSTSLILGVSESFEPKTSNIFTRRNLSGTHIEINKYLIQHLKELNLWNKDIRNKIIENRGSVQNIDEIPSDVKEIYKTVYEISHKKYLDLCASMQPYVDMSMSMNMYYKKQDINKISKSLFYAWKKGLKTGSYYTRVDDSNDTFQFALDNNKSCTMCSV
jgi:ribonucleotide reductase alpha subunit